MTRSLLENIPFAVVIVVMTILGVSTVHAGIVNTPPVAQQISLDPSSSVGDQEAGGVAGREFKNRKTVSALAKTMSKVLELETTAQGLDPFGNKGKSRKKICSLERRVERLLIDVRKRISQGVLSGNVPEAAGRELVIEAEAASQWAAQINGELSCTQRRP